MRFRALAALAVLLLSACQEPRRQTAQPPPDPTTEPWYAKTTGELRELTTKAALELRRRRSDRASALIEQARPLAAKLISVSRPTLAATEAASDLDDLYGRMLLANRHHGWARLQFQKNVARWTHWQPQTDETRRRLKVAQTAIAECDRLIAR